MKYIEKVTLTVSISDYLASRLSRAIDHYLTVLDASIQDRETKNRLRKSFLDEINEYHRETCRVCERVQESANASTS